MNEKPLVSVVVPTYNRERELKNALESLFEQTYPTMEIIVVDDGSTDGTAELIENVKRTASAEIKYLRQNHKGAAAARNKGASVVKGEVIFFMDDDCLPKRHCIEYLVQELMDDGVAAVSCRIAGGDEGFFSRCFDYAHYYAFMTNKREERDFLEGCGYAVKREAYELVNGFDESLKRGENEDFTRRLRKAGYKLVFQPKALLYHDHNRGNFTDFLSYPRRLGREGGVEIYLKYRDADYGRFASTKAFFYILLAPLIAFFVTGKIVYRVLSTDYHILVYSPFIFLNKLFFCLGTYEYLRREK